MIQLVVTLENGKTMNIISSADRKEEAKHLAVVQSKRLWGDKEYYVTANSKILNYIKLDRNDFCIQQNGNRLYLVAFMLNGVTQVLEVYANNAIGAYSNIKLKYGIEETPLTMVYDTNQTNMKRSAMTMAHGLCENRDLVDKILNRALNKMRMSEYFTRESVSLVNMAHSFNIGEYRNIGDTLYIKILASLIYYINPVDVCQDIVLSTKSISTEEDLIKWLVVNLNKEIIRYNEWVDSCNLIPVQF